MTHCSKSGPKLVKKCTLPVTAFGKASVIITEMCVLRFINGRFVLTDLAPETTVEEVRAATAFDFDLADEIGTMIE